MAEGEDGELDVEDVAEGEVVLGEEGAGVDAAVVEELASRLVFEDHAEGDPTLAHVIERFFLEDDDVDQPSRLGALEVELNEAEFPRRPEVDSFAGDGDGGDGPEFG